MKYKAKDFIFFILFMLFFLLATAISSSSKASQYPMDARIFYSCYNSIDPDSNLQATGYLASHMAVITTTYKNNIESVNGEVDFYEQRNSTKSYHRFGFGRKKNNMFRYVLSIDIVTKDAIVFEYPDEDPSKPGNPILFLTCSTEF